MSHVRCTRCGEEKPALAKAPFRDALGQEVLAHACADCWKEWMGYQVKLINELGLMPVNPEHGAVLERNLKAFLRLPSADAAGPDAVGAPPR
jgi:Fe-S cluster biosynthesis and repair protein YggX